MIRLFALLALLISLPVHAYIGPGAGIPILGSLLGILVTVIVAIGAILAWPVRKMLRKRKAAAAAKNAEPSEPI